MRPGNEKETLYERAARTDSTRDCSSALGFGDGVAMIHGVVPEIQGEPGVMPIPSVHISPPTALRTQSARALARARAKPAAHKTPLAESAFRSFWMGGYDDQAHPGLCGASLESGLFRESYGGLLEFGIRTIRENADWSKIDTPGGHDLLPLEARARMAKDLGMQIVWTLCCKQWPEDIRFLSSGFVERFAKYAGAVAARITEYDPGPAPVFVPINEISFLAWSLFSRGELRQKDGSHPTLDEIKRQLVRASIAASDAILCGVPHARLLHTDPLEHVVAPVDRVTLARGAECRTELQYEAWDWIAGRAGKDLGGNSRYLDLVGVNYYADNQWELGTGKRLGWQIDDLRRLPLSSLLKTVNLRYQRPIAVAETSHTGIRRGAWVREIAAEVRAAKSLGVRMEGICLHPLIDQVDGASPGKWLLRGLWEVRQEGSAKSLSLSAPYAAALRAAQKTIGGEQPLPAIPHVPATAA